MRSVNLLSLSEALLSSASSEYADYLYIHPKETEKEIIKKICERLIGVGATVGKLNGFYFGYNIPQIGKEFDLLRIGDNYILNLELKSTSIEENIKKQLVKNKCYLSSLTKPLYLYSYAADVDKLFELDNSDNLIEADFSDLLAIITGQTGLYTGDLNNLFRPFDYLVSPFNSTDDFMNDRYFLTPQQENITKDLEVLFSTSVGNIVSIEGAAGTGKSLLIYDYAKRVLRNGSRSIIVHVAQINQGQNCLMSEHGFSISSIRTFMRNITNSVLGNFDVILIDESQRLSSNQINNILDYVRVNRINCVLGYDEKQKMSDWEQNSDSVEVIRRSSVKKYSLGKKIRTNKRLISFINSMFDPSYGRCGDLAEVSLVYFDNLEHARQYLDANNNYQFIRYTPSMFYPHEINALATIETCVGASHEVIGQEFDNVSVLIGKTFYYDENGKLQSEKVSGNPYDFLGMLYQAVTRARKKLEVVIVDNPSVFKVLTNIIK